MDKLESIELVKNERIRQITEEGYSWRLDDQYTTHQLSNAAIVYATPAPLRYEIMNKWLGMKNSLSQIGLTPMTEE